jgi:two-component system response regulator
MEREKIVLLVEDNPDDVKLTRRAFKKCHIPLRLEVAEDGVEALEYLFRTGRWEGRGAETDTDVVLLDLKLPRIGGLEVLQKLRTDERTKHQPVVILTSSREEEDVTRGYDLCANSYIRKPVDFDEFVQAISQLGIYWLEMNEPPTRISRAESSGE